LRDEQRDNAAAIGSLRAMSNPHDDKWPDLAGRLLQDGPARTHVLPVRVYFEDTDFSGLVYHASYVRWCERGRSDFLRLLGGDHRRLIDATDGSEPAAFVVRRMTFDFLKPARIDELLEVDTRVKSVGAASLTLLQSIRRLETTLVEAEVTVVLISVSGKPLRISSALRAALGEA
jgi:acyl-CoA thioester hydrolase